MFTRILPVRELRQPTHLLWILAQVCGLSFYAYLSMAEGLDLPEGGAGTVFEGSYRLDDAEACLVVFPEKSG